MYRSVSGRPAWVSLGPGSYLGSLEVLWEHVRCRHAVPFLAIGICTITAVAVDLVGVALVASTSVSTYSQKISQNITFTYTNHNPHGELFDSIEFVFASGRSYPYVVQAPNGTIALLPILGNQVLSSYNMLLLGTLELTVMKDGAGASASYFAGYS